MGAPTTFHAPVCPFAQRFAILPTPEVRRNGVAFRVVDAAKPRPDLRSRRCPRKDNDGHSAVDAEPGG
jgi:hypothetical protein